MSNQTYIERTDRGTTLAISAFILIAIILRLYVLYFPISFFGYLVPPGDDAIRHFEMITKILNGNFNTGYPWLFHLFVAAIVKISGSGIVDVLRVITPALIVLPSIAVYLFLKKSFSQVAALIGFSILLWASNYALIAYGDGNYPNIVASGFFLPLSLLYLVLSLKERRLSYYLLAASFALLTLLTHHLSAAYLLFIVVIYIAVLGIWNRYERIADNYARATVFILVLLGIAGLIASLFSFRDMFIQAYHSIMQSGSVSAGVNFAMPIEFGEYGAQIGPFVYYGGLLGIMFLIYLLGQAKEKINKPALLLILVWFLVTYIFSRISEVGLPGRFARELALPLVLAESVMIWRFMQALHTNIQKILMVFAIGVIIVFELAQVNGGYYRSPSYFKKMIWFDSNDKKSADSIKAVVPQGETIIANNTSPYLPIFADRKIVFIPLNRTPSIDSLNAFASAAGARYVFIGQITSANPAVDGYSFFANFDRITSNLKKDLVQCDPIETDDSSSALYDLEKCPTKTTKVLK